MEERKFVPRFLLEKWEREAIAQNLPYSEFGSFLRMKERNYLESLDNNNQTEKKVFANDARNKLTDYGQKVALENILSIPDVERTCKIARFGLEEMKENLRKGFATDDQRQNFMFRRESWFSHLKERMKDLRISKETLAKFGLNWNECKSFAYLTI